MIRQLPGLGETSEDDSIIFEGSLLAAAYAMSALMIQVSLVSAALLTWEVAEKFIGAGLLSHGDSWTSTSSMISPHHFQFQPK